MGDVSRTKFKLGEAIYFLEQMRNTEKDGVPFLFNLSAHLSAVASIKNVMRNEFKGAEKAAFNAWANAQYAELNKIGFDRFINLRIRVVHHEGNLSEKIELDTVMTGTYLGLPTAVSPVNLALGMPPSNNGNYPIIDIFETTEEKYVWHFKGKREAVIMTCERFLRLLSEMVEEYQSKFYSRRTKLK